MPNPRLRIHSITSLHLPHLTFQVRQSHLHLAERRLHRQDLSEIPFRGHCRRSRLLDLASIRPLRMSLSLLPHRPVMDLSRVRHRIDYKLAQGWVLVHIVTSILVAIPSIPRMWSRPVSKSVGEVCHVSRGVGLWRMKWMRSNWRRERSGPRRRK